MFENYHHPSFYIELLLNLAGLVLAVVLIFRARDNKLMLTWGVYMLLIMLLIIASNAGLVAGVQRVGLMYRDSLLRIDILIGTFAVSSVATIFPILSLRPGWLTARRKILFAVPIILSFIVIRCFYWFDGAPTPLYSVEDVLANMYRPDVQMRVAVLLLSIITTLYYLFIPFIHRWVRGVRTISRGMYFYVVVVLLVETLYIFHVSTTNEVVAYIYGYVLLLALIFVSIIFLFNENPFSQPIGGTSQDHGQETSAGRVMSPELLHVYEQMERYMEENTPFTQVDYGIEQLATSLDLSQHLLIHAIRERGFSGYCEYLSN